VLVLFPVMRRGGMRLLRSRTPGLQVVRGFGVVGSAVLFISALQYLPLAEATAINFVSPAFVTLLSVPVLGERVGWRRWTALAVGMAGMLLIVRPGSDVFTPAALLPIVAAGSWAAAVVVTRRIGTTDPPMTTLIWTAGVGFVALTVLLLLGAIVGGPGHVQMPNTTELGLGLLIGIVSSAAQWLVVLAFRAAPASVLAPFSYAQLLFAGLLGFLMFGTVPDRWTFLGAGVIAASGLYTAHRERVRARERAARG
jgi:drug/metabolite transporter (DMT)-like permease